MKVESKIVVAFSLGFLALLLVGLATYLNARNLLARNNMVVHTYNVLNHIDTVFTCMGEIQTGARGYLLSGEAAYLQPYQGGLDGVSGEIAALRQSTLDNPVQQRNLDQLQSEVNRVIANVHQQVAARQAAPSNQGQTVISIKDKEEMDQVRFITAKMRAEERRLLDARTGMSSNSARQTLINFGLLLLLAIITLFGFLVFIRHDLAERRRIDEALRASDKKFRAVMDGAPDAMFITDEKGQVQMANSQAETLFGFTRNEFGGKQLDALLVRRPSHPHETGNSAENTLEHTREGALRVLESVSAQFDGVRKDGSLFPLDISRSPLNIGDEHLAITAVRDRTEYERAEESVRRFSLDLARSNAELERFAYVASHDLQEPLRMVSSYTQLLSKRYKGKLDDNADEFIAYAVDGASRMQKLINDLLALSRVGTQAKPSEPVDTGAVVSRVLNDMKPTIEAAGAVIQLPEKMPMVMADSGQIGQLFQNLIGNAIKFHGAAPPKIDIGVELEGEGPSWRFTVKDNGIGIEPQYFERIFVIFQRLHSKESYAGTGIGLAICKKIVERHGGRLWVNSQPGEGTTFFFTLPAALS